MFLDICQNRKGNAYAYAYDNNGNITSITRNSTVAVSYQYNGANELVRENNGFTNQTAYCDYLRIVRGIEGEKYFKPLEKNFLDSLKRS